MTDEKPEPITPEGKRAADRIRTIFFSIAAANIVLVAIVIWQRQAHKSPEDKPVKPAATEESAKERESGDRESTDSRGK